MRGQYPIQRLTCSHLRVQCLAIILRLRDLSYYVAKRDNKVVKNEALSMSRVDPMIFHLPNQLAKRLDDIPEECYNRRGYCAS